MTDTQTQVEVVEEIRLILTELGVNSNKFWTGKRYADNTVVTHWGRVGDAGQSKTFSFPDAMRAEKYLATKRKEKERKGYSEQKTIGGTVKVSNSNAAQVIDHGGDDDTKKLIDYLVQVNIHNITSSTSITYNVASGSFSTPLGIVTAEGIREAENILAEMGGYVERQIWNDRRFEQLVNDYMRIVPTVIGRRKPELRDLYPDVTAIQAQQQIIDSLRASLQALETSSTADPEAKSFRASIKLLRHDEGEGTATFKRILKKYLESLNKHHTSANLRLRRVFEIKIGGMSSAYEHDGAKLDNRWELWHGTRAANLLSIMNSGYVVPRSGGSIAVTGRMFGDGVYFSDQSSKSLNYSAGYWGGGRTSKAYMLLNEVAMGKFYVPRSSFSGGCRAGFDSTFAKAGQSGVLNNEMIVYRTSQIKPQYLCEFE